MADIIDLLAYLFFLIVGVLSAIVGIPVFVTGFRAGAGLTVFIGLVFMLVSLSCWLGFFYFRF